MLRNVKIGVIGSAAIASSLFSSNAPPAFASDKCTDPYNVVGDCALPYAGYYAPYAVLLAAGQVSVKKLDEWERKKKEALNANRNESGTVVAAKNELDVESQAMRGAFTSDDFGKNADFIQKLALQALRPNNKLEWQYSFGYDQYLGCLDQADEECKGSLPPRPSEVNVKNGPVLQVWARVDAEHPKPTIPLFLLVRRATLCSEEHNLALAEPSFIRWM